MKYDCPTKKHESEPPNILRDVLQGMAAEIAKQPRQNDKPPIFRRESEVCQCQCPGAFPIDALSGPMKCLAESVSQAVDCEPVYAALPALVLAASMIGTTRKLQIAKGHYAPSVLWAAIVAPSGSAKSPCADAVFAPASSIQRLRIREHQQAIDKYESDLVQYQAAVKRKDGTAGEQPKPPKPVRYFTRDATVESLCSLLHDNPRGLLYSPDELAQWLGMFDRYSGGTGGSDRANWLAMYDAREVIVDRKGSNHKKPVYVASAAVSVFGSVQSRILSKLLTEEDRASGLAARLLLVQPPVKALWWTGKDISESVSMKWHNHLNALLTLDHGRDDADEPTSVMVRLSPEATEAYKAYYNRISVLWESSSDDDYQASLAKLRNVAARLATIVHTSRSCDGERVDPLMVDTDSMVRGITLADY
ncbi:MAG: DUF3987 domain-containing protein, partial [Phycisphaerales bacterium]|nr:DUF3987 domain-containing protein [Phycisphaerales bacterium]